LACTFTDVNVDKSSPRLYSPQQVCIAWQHARLFKALRIDQRKAASGLVYKGKISFREYGKPVENVKGRVV
jgi:hypothetical protein